ncbi:MAG: hypothetical protein AAF382_09400, partial [Pseudomonadota bacterium]
MPKYVTDAPKELREILIERKYAKAVKLVQKVRKFRAILGDTLDSDLKAQALFSEVEAVTKEIVDKIKVELG